MYPTAFPRRHWYVAGHADELRRELMSRRILGDPICFYRRGDGAPVALVDRCIHRQMPLSMGRLKGDDLECGYHGILFGDDGIARRVPSQRHVHPACRVHRYPLVESGGLLWIWMGEPERADEALIPEHPWLQSPGWAVVRGRAHAAARAQLLNENLLDLSHLSFLHPETIGTEQVAETPITTRFDDQSVRVTRTMAGIDSPALFEKTMGLTGRIDREQVAEFVAPGFHITHVTAQPADAAVADEGMCRHKAVHCITPETATTAHYFWAVARDYRVDDPAVGELWAAATPVVIGQDIAAAEAIEGVIATYEPGYPTEINIKVDAGPLRARRIIETMISAEQDVTDAGNLAGTP